MFRRETVQAFMTVPSAQVRGSPGKWQFSRGEKWGGVRVRGRPVAAVLVCPHIAAHTRPEPLKVVAPPSHQKKMGKKLRKIHLQQLTVGILFSFLGFLNL